MDGANPRKQKPGRLAVAGASVYVMNGLGASHHLLILRTLEHLQPGALLAALLPEKKDFGSARLEAERRGLLTPGEGAVSLCSDGRRQHGIGPEDRFILPGV